MIVKPAFIRGKENGTYRHGQWAKIEGCEFRYVAPPNKEPEFRLCFRVVYVDGVIDHIWSDSKNLKNYEISDDLV